MAMTILLLLFGCGFRRTGFEVAFEAGELFGEHLVGERRPFAESAFYESADNVVEHEIGPSGVRLQREGKRAIDALGLKGSKCAAQSQRLSRIQVRDEKVLDRAAVRQLLAEASARLRIQRQVGGAAGECVPRTPPFGGVQQRGIDAIRWRSDMRYLLDRESIRCRFHHRGATALCV